MTTAMTRPGKFLPRLWPAIGWGILGETFRMGAVTVTGAALTVLVTSLALAILARSVPPPGGEEA
jgi:hypothetical protein